MKLTQMTLSMSVAAMALGPVPMASAQEQAAANAGQEDAENVLDSVVVTATKRSESQQDVGLTVAAFAVELGFKTDWPRQSLRLNGAVFYYDRRDVQASGIDESGIVPIARLTNIGDVEVYGAELEAVWAPIRQLTLQGGLSWLENEIVSSDKIPGNLFNSPEPATFVGARLPNQPELSANMVARYEEYVSARMLAGLQITYTYRGEQDLGLVVFQTPMGRGRIPSYCGVRAGTNSRVHCRNHACCRRRCTTPMTVCWPRTTGKEARTPESENCNGRS